MSGISQPIGYCTSRSAIMSQWSSFAVVPYCKRSVMRFLRENSDHEARVTRVWSGVRDSHRGVRHRIDRTGAGGAFARAGITSRHRKCIAHDRLDDEAIGRRCQSVTNAEVHVKDAELEIGHGEQSVLLFGKFCKIPDLAKVGVIFESREQIRSELACHARRRRKVRLAIFPEADVHDRVDDEFVVRIANADDGPYLQPKP